MHKQLKVCRDILAVLLMAKDLADFFLSTCVEKSLPEGTSQIRGRAANATIDSARVAGVTGLRSDAEHKLGNSVTRLARETGHDPYQLQCSGEVIGGKAEMPLWIRAVRAAVEISWNVEALLEFRGGRAYFLWVDSGRSVPVD